MDHEDKKEIPRRQTKPSVKGKIKLTEAQQAEVDQAVAAAFIQYTEQIENERTKHRNSDLEQLDTLLSEHLGPYILIGYNLSNEPIEIFNANNALEAGALSEYFKKVFIERAVKHGGEFM